MEVIVLNGVEAQVKELFSRYVPLEYEHYLNDEGIVLGAVDTDTEDSLFEPAGIAVIAGYEGQLALKWMWIDPDKRFKDGGCSLLEACMNIADENGLETFYAHVPVLDAETVEDSDITGFFYENNFSYVRDADTEDGKVFVLAADVAAAVSLGLDEENRQTAREIIAEGYETFPNKFEVTDVEYYSGVPTE